MRGGESMFKGLVDLLHKLNGAYHTERRIEQLAKRIEQLAKRVQDVQDRILCLQERHCEMDWPRYAGFGAPLYLLRDGRLALNDQVIENAEKAVVISIPKSGTYLVAAILQKLGFVNTGVHVWETGFHDYRSKSIPEMVHRYSEFAVNAPLTLTAPLVLPGQFMVGHIGFRSETRAALSSFRRIMTVREMRHALVSHMRFFLKEGRGLSHDDAWKDIADPRQKMVAFLELFGDELLDWACIVSKWHQDQDTLMIKFETLLGDYGAANQQAAVVAIGSHVGKSITAKEVEEFLGAVLNQPTKTWSGRRTDLADYWSDNCEEFFIAVGGLELNERLGYSS